MTVSELPFAWIMLTMDGRVAESHPSRDLGARHFWEAMTPWAVPEMGHRGLTPTRLGCVSTCARLERQSPRGVSLARMLAAPYIPTRWTPENPWRSAEHLPSRNDRPHTFIEAWVPYTGGLWPTNSPPIGDR